MTDTPPTGTSPATPATPPTPGARPAAPPTGRARGLVTFGVAVIALIFALVAMSVAVYATVQASQARKQVDQALMANGGRQPAGSGGDAGAQPSKPAVTQPGGASPQPTLSEIDVLDPTATYKEKYTAQVLNPTATRDSTAYIDLDTPKIQHESDGADLSLRLEYNGNVPYFSFDEGAQVALAPSADATPEDCRKALTTALLNQGTTIPAQRDAKLCILTSQTAAQKEGVPVRLVLLHVTLLDGGKVTIRLTAWQLV